MKKILTFLIVTMTLLPGSTIVAASAYTEVTIHDDGRVEATAIASGNRYTIEYTRTREGSRPYGIARAVGVDRDGGVAHSFSRAGDDWGFGLDFGVLEDGTPGAKLYNLGLSAFYRRDYATAIAYLAVLTRTAPENPMPLYFLAICFSRSGDKTAAQVVLEAAVQKEIAFALPNWGKYMQRIQGTERLWVETARKAEGLGPYVTRAYQQ